MRWINIPMAFNALPLSMLDINDLLQSGMWAREVCKPLRFGYLTWINTKFGKHTNERDNVEAFLWVEWAKNRLRGGNLYNKIKMEMNEFDQFSDREHDVSRIHSRFSQEHIRYAHTQIQISHAKMSRAQNNHIFMYCKCERSKLLMSHILNWIFIFREISGRKLCSQIHSMRTRMENV